MATTPTQAHRGDVVEVSARRVGEPSRLGEILEILGQEGHPHYRVRWEDGHETFLYPGAGTTVRGRPDRGQRQQPKLELAATTEHLVELLRGVGAEFELLPHRRTTRAAGEAHALGVEPDEVAKTVIARGDDGRCVRAVVAGSSRLDLERLATATGMQTMELLEETDLVSAYPQFELGAVPPFGGPQGDRVVVDRGLAHRERVVLDAGVHDTSLRLRVDDLVTVSGAELADISTE